MFRPKEELLSKSFWKKVCFLAFWSIFLLFSRAWAGRIVLKVFHAGSLSVPFKEIEKAFEAQYPWIDVQLESSGSVKAIRKVIDLHKPCDVVASADYSLIPQMMFPVYADHVKLFARNELVLCYTKRSKFAKEINSRNWYKILAREGVKWAFSNPNLDPCGYRAMMCILLAEAYYKKPLAESLLSRYLSFEFRREGPLLIAIVPKSFVPRGHKIFIRPKSVELLGLLESGTIDYAIEYLSVALQHGLKYVKLPPEINLSQVKYAAYYSRVRVRLGTGRVVSGKPIVYGIAALKTATHPQEAKLFEDFVTSKKGAQILRAFFQTPIYPAKLITNQ